MASNNAGIEKACCKLETDNQQQKLTNKVLGLEAKNNVTILFIFSN